MQKILLSLLAIMLWANVAAWSQKNEEFKTLLVDFKPLLPPVSVGSYEMSENLNYFIDNQLAWKFLYQSSTITKPSETYAHPIAWYKLNEKVAVLFFYTGKPDDEVLWVTAQSYNFESGKLIDELKLAGSFMRSGEGACNINVQANRKIVSIKTATMRTTEVKLSISDKGKFEVIQ